MKIHSCVLVVWHLDMAHHRLHQVQMRGLSVAPQVPESSTSEVGEPFMQEVPMVEREEVGDVCVIACCVCV